MSRIIDRALDIINDRLKTQVSSLAPTMEVKPAMKSGGYVLEDDYPTHYLPHVGRQVMADGGMPDDPIGSAVDIAQNMAPLPDLTPAAPAPSVPSAEGRVGAPTGHTIASKFESIPEGAPWAEKAKTETARPMTLKSMAKSFTDAIAHHTSLPRDQMIKNSMDAERRMAPYVGMRKDNTLVPFLGKNAKLMKTEAGYKGRKPIELEDGRGVETTGLALAPAFQYGSINTCPNHASCKAECLGKTSGNYFKLGGGQDLSEFKGPRLNSLNKTVAFFQDPEAFAVRLHDEIASAQAEAAKNGNKLGVRLNVLSDIHPSVYKSIIDAFPDVDFYDYTKLNVDPVAPNHHYTYSSTGVSDEDVNNFHQNWKLMRNRLDNGQNVAMAFSHKQHLPESINDEETGKTYRVINGDTHDFRPLDKVGEGEEGVIVGLKNKKAKGKQADAHKDSKGFFVKYDPQLLRNEKGTYLRGESPGISEKTGKPKLGPTVPGNKSVTIGTQTKLSRKDKEI